MALECRVFACVRSTELVVPVIQAGDPPGVPSRMVIRLNLGLEKREALNSGGI